MVLVFCFFEESKKFNWLGTLQSRFVLCENKRCLVLKTCETPNVLCWHLLRMSSLFTLGISEGSTLANVAKASSE